MPYPLFESLVRQLSDPRTLLLNYSGESTVYPDLIPAIRLARSTGAFVELVSALASVSEAALPELSRSGLSRLTVSIHTTDAAEYREIYRYGSFEAVRSRLVRFLELCREVTRPPMVDLAFVAMNQNLGQLPAVAGLANSLGLRNVFLFPVIRRDEIPVHFPRELNAVGAHRPEFETRVKATVEQTRQAYPEVGLTVCNPSFTDAQPALGEVPVAYPGPLPAGARIHSCEQNPWETAHVLSNGDVVACEVLDKKPLGNLARQSLGEIWHGEAYGEFRQRYFRGEVAECRSCPWKQAYRPGPLHSEIIGARGRSAQLVHGWHNPTNEAHVWSSRQALAVVAPRAGSRTLHVSGMLPPGPEGDPNELTICCQAREIGKVVNPWREVMPFGLDFPVGAGPSDAWTIEFRTRHLTRPSERGMGDDQRDLGFALVLLASQRFVDPESARRRKQALQSLARAVEAIDGLGRKMRRCFRRPANGASPRFRPGLSILIPERGNLEELPACLESVHEAARHWPEPIEAIVVVNGSARSNYAALARCYPGIKWQFHELPLGFSGAVSAGLRDARFDWVYLLNNDVVLEPEALHALGGFRDGATFAVASQIVLKDVTRYRDESNWTALLVEDGLATIHDRIPQTDRPADTFYAGGGASLFQTRLLASFLDAAAYHPFYWEDVEWGWRARKLGYRSIFCPASVAHHRQRSTISRYYTPDEIEAVLDRNRFLFQLRNFTTVGSTERVLDEIARSSGPVGDYFCDRRTIWRIARARLWNHLAPLGDQEVLGERSAAG